MSVLGYEGVIITAVVRLLRRRTQTSWEILVQYFNFVFKLRSLQLAFMPIVSYINRSCLAHNCPLRSGA